MLDDKIIEMQQEIIEKVRECIAIRSVLGEPEEGKPFGDGPYQALEYTLGLSKELGFKTVNIDNMIGYAEYGEGEEMVAVLGHLDVVPEGSGWHYPPYEAQIHDGKIYARGIVDDKGPVIGALYALKAIKDMDIPLKKRVRIIFGTNEESGSKCAKRYSETEEIPAAGFTPDACYPIINGEKGIVNVTCSAKITNNTGIKLVKISGGTAPNAVPDYAQVELNADEKDRESIKNMLKGCRNIELKDDENLLIQAFGITAHGSTPELGLNAISVLCEALAKLDIDDKIMNTVKFINDSIGLETDGKSLGIALEDQISGKLTVNLGTMDMCGDKLIFKLNIRYPVTKKYEEFSGKLIGRINDAGIVIEDIVHKKSLYVDPSEEFIKKLQKVYMEKTGREPRLISYGGGTYAKSLKNIVAFGPIFEGEPDLDHKPDENMSIESLLKNIQIIAAAIVELAQ